MNNWINIVIINLFIWIGATHCYAQYEQESNYYRLSKCVFEGDTLLWVQLRDIYVFKPLVFKNEKEKREYDRLVYNVKKTLPIAKEVNQAIIETYEYLQTLPTEKEKQKHIKKIEKGLKEQYTPRLKKLTLSQGKLLIKLVDRETNQSSYELTKAFLGSFRAGFYQVFAGLFGASLKKEYDPTGEDKLTERVVLLVENGQL